MQYIDMFYRVGMRIMFTSTAGWATKAAWFDSWWGHVIFLSLKNPDWLLALHIFSFIGN